MNALELAEVLEIQFGNPLGPKVYDNVKLAVAMLRLQHEEIKALMEQIK
jgi:hypothetical protein